MKPDKRPQQGQRGTPGSGRQPVTRLWQGVRRISKEGALLPQPKASARGDPPLSRELLSRLPPETRSTTKEPDELGWVWYRWYSCRPKCRARPREVPDTARKRRRARSPSTEWLPATGSCTLQVGTVTLQTNDETYHPRSRKHKRQENRQVPGTSRRRWWKWKLRTTRGLCGPPDSPLLHRSQRNVLHPLERSGHLARPNLSNLRRVRRAWTSPLPRSSGRVQAASTRQRMTRPTGPKRPKSIWFDTTEPSEVAAAMQPRKRASRRQMFQTVLLISAANRAAEAQQDAEDTPKSHRPRQMYKRDCADRLPRRNLNAVLLHTWQPVIVPRPRSTALMTGYPGKGLWYGSQQSPMLPGHEYSRRS